MTRGEVRIGATVKIGKKIGIITDMPDVAGTGDKGQARCLTPEEEERRQGFSGNHTAIPWEKEIAPAALRYKAIGNSMAIPVMRWIGERVQFVENLIGDKMETLQVAKVLEEKAKRTRKSPVCKECGQPFRGGVDGVCFKRCLKKNTAAKVETKTESKKEETAISQRLISIAKLDEQIAALEIKLKKAIAIQEVLRGSDEF